MFQIIQAFIMFTYLFRLRPTPTILSLVFLNGMSSTGFLSKVWIVVGQHRQKTVLSQQCFMYLPVSC